MDGRYPAKIGLGMVWYRRDDFPRILEIMVDRDRLHRSYDEWEKAAEQGEAELLRAGRIVIRAMLDPDEFITWCAEHEMELDARARNRWSADIAHRELSGKS